MSVYTVYNCGTNFHRNSRDVIAYLNGVTTSPHSINDGVGSGDWNPFHRQGPGRGNPGGVNKLGGLIFGSGAQANVDAAVAALKAHIAGQVGRRTPPVMNMAGWSRGAVTCFKIANAMNNDNDLRNIPVNIFAIDPVPGSSGPAGKAMWRDIQLSGNVNNCTVILAQHDSRRLFAPVVPTAIPGGCRYFNHVMPGNHSSIVQEKQGLEEAAQVVKDMALKFLRRFQTAMTDRTSLTEAEIVEKYAIMAKNWDNYKKKAGKWFTSRTVVSQDSEGRHVRTLRPEQSSFFINDHHREAYVLRWPQLYHELNLPAIRAFDKLRYRVGWGREIEEMQRGGWRNSWEVVFNYAHSIGKDCTPPRPARR
jgi:hypothetical protein